MNCPFCNTEDTDVVDTREPPEARGKAIKRRRWCKAPECARRFNTIEKPDRDLAETVFPRTQPTVSQQTQQTVSTETQHAVSTKHRRLGLETQPLVPGGGRGVGLGSSSSSLSSSGSSGSELPLDPLLVSDQRVDRAKGGAIDYPAAFELLWEQTGKRGGKYPALKAWKKAGKPTWDRVGDIWRAYMLSERPVAGYVKDLSSWLSARYHEQDWPPAPTRGRPTANGHSPVTAGKDYEAGMDAFKKRTA